MNNNYNFTAAVKKKPLQSAVNRPGLDNRLPCGLHRFRLKHYLPILQNVAIFLPGIKGRYQSPHGKCVIIEVRIWEPVFTYVVNILTNKRRKTIAFIIKYPAPLVPTRVVRLRVDI